MDNPYYERYKEEYEKAPCYYHLVDDGASMRCQGCEELFNPNSLIITFTPNKAIPKILCPDCVDDYWLEIATDLGMFKERN